MKRLFVLIACFLLFAVPGFGADYTTTKAVLMDWTLLNDTATTASTLETTPLVIDTWIGCTLHIDVAHIDTDAGTAVTVKIWAKSGTTDECWHVTQELSATMGAANTGDIDQSCAAAQPNVYLLATTNFEDAGQVFFLQDVGDITASAIAVVKDGKNHTADYIICVDNLVNTYATDDVAWDVVDQWSPRLSPGFTYRVTFHNTDTAANYACRVHYVTETDIE